MPEKSGGVVFDPGGSFSGFLVDDRDEDLCLTLGCDLPIGHDIDCDIKKLKERKSDRNKNSDKFRSESISDFNLMKMSDRNSVSDPDRIIVDQVEQVVQEVQETGESENMDVVEQGRNENGGQVATSENGNGGVSQQRSLQGGGRVRQRHDGVQGVDEDVVQQQVVSFPTSEMNYARITETNRESKILNVHIKIDEQSAGPHIHLSVAEQAKLVFVKMAFPHSGVVKGIQLKNARLLKIELPKDYDDEPHLLSYELSIRSGITVLPMIERSRQVEVEVRMIGLDTTDDSIKDSLKYFGEVLSIQPLPIRLTDAELADPITRLMAELERGKGERMVQMILNKNIPSFIIIDDKKAKIHFKGQEWTCKRCFLSFKNGCRGRGVPETCEERGTPLVPLKTLWDRWIRANSGPVIPHDTSYEGDTILIKGVKRGLKVEDVRNWLNAEFGLDLRAEQVLATGDFNHMVIRDLTSVKMRTLAEVVTGQTWEGKKVYCQPHQESTPMKISTDRNMAQEDPRYFRTKEEARRDADAAAREAREASEREAEERRIEEERKAEEERRAAAERQEEIDRARRERRESLERMENDQENDEEDWIRRSNQSRLEEYYGVGDWSTHVEDEEGKKKEDPKPQRKQRVFVPKGAPSELVQQKIDELNESSNRTPVLNLGTSSLAPAPATTSSSTLAPAPAPGAVVSPTTEPVSASTPVSTAAAASTPSLATALTTALTAVAEAAMSRPSTPTTTYVPVEPIIIIENTENGGQTQQRNLTASALLMPPPQIPQFFDKDQTRTPTPIQKVFSGDNFDLSGGSNPVNLMGTPAFLRNTTPTDTEVFQSPNNLMSSTILEPAPTTDIMSMVAEKAKGVLETMGNIGRKSTELLAFDNILSKKSESGKSTPLELSREELDYFGEAAEISAVETSSKVGSFSTFDNSSLNESAVTEDQIYQFNQNLMKPRNYKSEYANMIQDTRSGAHVSRLPRKTEATSKKESKSRSRSVKRSFKETGSPTDDGKLPEAQETPSKIVKRSKESPKNKPSTSGTSGTKKNLNQNQKKTKNPVSVSTQKLKRQNATKSIAGASKTSIGASKSVTGSAPQQKQLQMKNVEGQLKLSTNEEEDDFVTPPGRSKSKPVKTSHSTPGGQKLTVRNKNNFAVVLKNQFDVLADVDGAPAASAAADGKTGPGL